MSTHQHPPPLRRRPTGLPTALAIVAILLAAPASGETPPRVRVPPAATAPPASEAEHAKLKERVRELNAQAEQAITDGRDEEALATVSQMLALRPEARLALFRADILRGLGRSCEAFDAVLLASTLRPDPEQKREIAENLKYDGADCAPGMGWATFGVEPEVAATTAEITVSGHTVPLGRTVGLAAGEHRVEVKAPGYLDCSSTITAVAGAEAKAHIKLEPPPPEPPPAPAPKDSDASLGDSTPIVTGVTKSEVHPSSSIRWERWAVVAGGAALVATGAVFHVKAFGAVSDADDLLSRTEDLRTNRGDGWEASYNELRGRHEDTASQAVSNQTVAYILYGAGAVATTVGVMWLLSSDTAAEPAAWSLHPAVSPAGPGLSLRGGF